MQISLSAVREFAENLRATTERGPLAQQGPAFFLHSMLAESGLSLRDQPALRASDAASG